MNNKEITKYSFLFNKKAVTLIEIIIASFIAIMLLSVFATVDYSVRLMHKRVNPNSLLAVQTMAIFNHISQNLLLTTGDHVSYQVPESGIEVYSNNSISIFQDRNTPPTPDDYTDDTWVYYHLHDNNIQFCQGRGTCDSVLADLGTGKIKLFEIELRRNSASDSLQNELIVRIAACQETAICVPADDDYFSTETTFSLPSFGGMSI